MSKIIRIVITGPECTGKSTLAKELARHYKAEYIPEYARTYIENLGREYTYSDLEHIAEVQLKQASVVTEKSSRIIFYDTFLIITKIWFQVVYNKYPEWIDKELRNDRISLYLLCDTSIPWTPDNVRENGGTMREELFNRYKNELDSLGLSYVVIHGMNKQRLIHAIEAINQFFPDICR